MQMIKIDPWIVDRFNHVITLWLEMRRDKEMGSLLTNEEQLTYELDHLLTVYWRGMREELKRKT